MENWITEFIGEHGYFGVCFLLLGKYIPSDSIRNYIDIQWICDGFYYNDENGRHHCRYYWFGCWCDGSL